MSEPRSILVVSPYRAEYGPPQTLAYVAEALAGAGYRPVCVVPPGAHLTERMRALGTPVHVLPGLTTFPRTFNVFRLVAFLRAHIAASRRIARIARTERAAAVYSISEAIFCGSLAARRVGIPSLVHVIGMSIQSPRWAAHVYIRLLGRLTDRFIACSSAAAEMLAGYGLPDTGITVVHNGIPVAEVESTDGVVALLAEGPRIGMVAAYDPRKGHELFVDAAAIIARRHPEARFYLIGGALEGQAESLAFSERIAAMIDDLGLADRFERVGFVPQPEVYRWIRSMDVVVVPSKTEAFAHALLEGMVCGKPVVATAIEGNLDAFVNGQSGIYVETEPKAVADAVSSLLEDPARRAAMGNAARERARLLFDLGVTQPALAHAVSRLVRTAAASSPGPTRA
jgi:glycosyltransferase involved in cell wall biosynthesis